MLNGRYLMYDGIRAFGKERNRVKYMGGKMPGGYWPLDGWNGFVDDRALYSTYIGYGKKLPNITDPAPTGL